MEFHELISLAQQIGVVCLGLILARALFWIESAERSIRMLRYDVKQLQRTRDHIGWKFIRLEDEIRRVKRSMNNAETKPASQKPMASTESTEANAA